MTSVFSVTEPVCCPTTGRVR
jgi:hypothetical protein